MDNLDHLERLSDDELRRKLLQNGFANLPITQSTRKIIIKKLRNHLGKTNSDLLARYSSDDGEESDYKQDALKGKKNRMTVSGSPASKTLNQIMPPPMSSGKHQSSFGASANRNSAKKSSIYVSPVIINDSDGDDSNSTSDYTRRLLQLREETIQRQANNFRQRASARTSLRKSEHLENIVFHAQPSVESARIPFTTAVKNFINRLDTTYGLKQTFVPMLLVALVIMFFVMIFFLYVTISPDIENLLTESSTIYVPCHGLSDHQETDGSYNCIDESSLDPTLKLIKQIVPELQARSALSCSGESSDQASNVMCFKEISQFLSSNHANDNHRLELIRLIHNAQYLVDKNKNLWGIFNSDSNGNFKSLDEVLTMRLTKSECFVKPKLPITCTIQKKLQSFFFIIGAITLLSLLVFAARKLYQFVMIVKQRKRAQTDYIVREICRILSESSQRDRPFVVLSQLRDKIIAPSKQAELKSAWQEAINYIRQNDSRIQFGVDMVNGESVKGFRWIEDVAAPTSPVSKSPTQFANQQKTPTLTRSSAFPYQTDSQAYATVKKWRCSAFDHSNKIKDPPTNCLKIRQMFDKYEANSVNLQTIIQDTILHKLKDKNCKIYDVQLDLKTCCVYVKCASLKCAGIVHEEINGWWLDSGLVIVKFLKQDKYHQRFPGSINATTQLFPSSNVYITNSDSNSNGHEYYEDDMEDFE